MMGLGYGFTARGACGVFSRVHGFAIGHGGPGVECDSDGSVR